VRRQAVVPVLAAAPGVCLGIQPLLDFIVECFPAPTDRPAWKGKIGDEPTERAADPAAPVAAYVWKTCTSDIGRLSLLRVISGSSPATPP
jgi:elongation factor G